jgi:hypothetical protein
MHFVAALDSVSGMHPVLCLFEGVATGAADGYGRIAGKPAATLLHLGPGLANGLACNDDDGLSGCLTSRQSQIMLQLNPGTYRLVLSGCGEGAATIHFQHLPVGNGPIAALPAGGTAPTGTTAGTGRVAPACSVSGLSGPENTYYWYTCGAATGGAFSASTCGRATWDTLLEQRSALRTANICNDDGSGGTCGRQSTVTSTIPAGAGIHTLYVDGFGSASGAYSVAINRP